MSKKWNKEARNELYVDAINTWGIMAQVDMLVEELGECVVATQKLFKRDYSLKRMQDFASEVADVKIMLEEIHVILDEMVDKKPEGYKKSHGTFAEMVQEQIEFKLERTKQRLADTKFKLQNTPEVL